MYLDKLAVTTCHTQRKIYCGPKGVPCPHEIEIRLVTDANLNRDGPSGSNFMSRGQGVRVRLGLRSDARESLLTPPHM